MAKGKRHKSGRVIWATNIPDRSGTVKPQARPLLVVPPDPGSDNALLCCLAISTRPASPHDADRDLAIEMPWDATTGDTTGLYKWCSVVVLWHVLVDPRQVTKVSGVVSQAFLTRVLAEREQALLRAMRKRGT